MMTKVKFVLWLSLFLVLTYYLGNFLIWLKVTLEPMTVTGLKLMTFGVRVAMVVLAIKCAFICICGGSKK